VTGEPEDAGMTEGRSEGPLGGVEPGRSPAEGESIGEVKKQFATLIVAAFGFIAALVWKDAVMAMLAPVLEWGEGWIGLTIVAAIVTIIAILVIFIIGWMFKKERQKCENDGGKWEDNTCQKK